MRQNADGLIIISSEGKPLYANPAAEQIFGDDLEDLINETTGIPFWSPDVAEMELVRPGGDKVLAEIRMSDIDWDGEPALLASVRDISERRRAEHLRRELAAQKLVSDELRRLSELKSQFVDLVTHELRTPMTAIQAGVGLLLQQAPEQLSADQLELLQLIERNTARLNRFTTDVLDLSRLEAGSHELRKVPTSLNAVLEPAVRLMALKARQHDISVEIREGEGRDLMVLADADALTRVVTNLVGNAITHCPGGTRVYVSTAQRNGVVQVAVSDDGQGIPAADLPMVFDRFYRVRRRSGGAKPGSGLGLTLCKSLMTALDGELTVESTEGEGCTFRLTLPLAAAAQEDN